MNRRVLLADDHTLILAAFEQLIVLHEQRVYQTALAVLRHEADAQDAAQEVFLRVYKNQNRLCFAPTDTRI